MNQEDPIQKKEPLMVTQEQMEYVDLKYGPGTAKRYIDAGVFEINPNVHGLFPEKGVLCGPVNQVS